MKLGIVLLNYCNAEITLECINSINLSRELLTRDTLSVEVIVVDNNSKDDSASVLNCYRTDMKYIFIPSSVNEGFSSGNNIGIKYCLDNDFDFIMLLNNDTEIETSFLQLLEGLLDENIVISPKINNYYKKNIIWYGGGGISRITGKATHYGENKIDSYKYNNKSLVDFTSGCCFIASRNVFETAGLLNEDYFLYWEDVDYSIRLIKNNFNITYEPSLVVYHKINTSIGNDSKTLLYYGTRNRIILVKKYSEFFYCSAYIITVCIELIKALKYIFLDYDKANAIMKAIKDGIKGITGRVDLK